MATRVRQEKKKGDEMPTRGSCRLRGMLDRTQIQPLHLLWSSNTENMVAAHTRRAPNNRTTEQEQGRPGSPFFRTFILSGVTPSNL